MLSFLASAAAAAADHGQQQGIAEMFGIQWTKLVAQIATFLLVYLILNKYAFGPVMGLLEERRKRIAENEENLEKSRSGLANAEAKAAEIVAKANAEADRLVKEAREAAGIVGEKKRQEAIAEATQIIAKAREASEQERAKLLGDLKRDFSRLVVATTGKVTGKVLGADDQDRLSKEALDSMSL